MAEKKESIMKHYTELSCDVHLKQTNQVEELLYGLEISGDKHITQKLLEIKKYIEANIKHFYREFAHVDIVTGILDYLDLYINVKYSQELILFQNITEELNLYMPYNDTFLLKLFYTLYFMSGSKGLLQLYSKVNPNSYPLHDLPAVFNTAVIVFEDADYYAVNDSILMNKKQTHINIKGIWLQGSIKYNRNNILSEEAQKDFKMFDFRSKEEACTEIMKEGTLESLSIWSEDIISAKNFAETVKVPLVFINGSEEICREITLPSIELHCKKFTFKSIYDKPATKPLHSKVDIPEEANIHYLFYDNTWTKPIDDLYFEHQSQMWADASRADAIKCLNSANEGFKLWSSYPIDRRNKILRKFADQLYMKSHHKLPTGFLSWIETPRVFQNTLLRSKDETLEVFITRRPSGVVVILGRHECILPRIVQALITGNSVIILPTYDTVQHVIDFIIELQCYGIPPGVVNFLSSIDIDSVLSYFVERKEVSVICQGEERGKELLEMKLLQIWYMKYTLPKYVLLPIK